MPSSPEPDAGVIESGDSDQRVAVIASGGLSHFAIEPDLDALQRNDAAQLTELPNQRCNSSTAELRNWIALEVGASWRAAGERCG